jgi:hypothetical protein
VLTTASVAAPYTSPYYTPLQAGADPNYIPPSLLHSPTALHAAVEGGAVELVQLLVVFGAKLDAAMHVRVALHIFTQTICVCEVLASGHSHANLCVRGAGIGPPTRLLLGLTPGKHKLVGIDPRQA